MAKAHEGIQLAFVINNFPQQRMLCTHGVPARIGDAAAHGDFEDTVEGPFLAA